MLTSLLYRAGGVSPLARPMLLGIRPLRQVRPISFFGRTFKPPQSAASQLSAKEQVANRQLHDPAAQATFYRDLLTANYPQQVVQRYESGGGGRNAECTRLYAQALRDLGKTDQATTVEKEIAGSGAGAGIHKLLNTKGTKGDPVHVVASETNSAVAFKWLKWIIRVVLVVYAIAAVSVFLSENPILTKGAGPDLGSSKLNAVRGEKSKVKFSDVQGVDEARGELEEIVEFLKDPSKFTGLGGKLPKGVLLTGPPGTGKTLLARAVAGEAGVPFFFMSGSEFDEMYVGVGAKRIRELFAAAKKEAPAIVFIDELDAIGGTRNPKDQAYSKQTLNQLLVDLDGFNQTTGVIFIAATNFPEMLDKALTRPGRFDKIVNVELPDVRGRAAILKHHMTNVEVDPKVNVMNIARGTSGFSGADLMNLVNQAAIRASQLKELSVGTNDFEWAKDKILMGAERKTMVMTEETRRNTAFHEAGHAIMAMYTPGATPLYKATILPRGRALGVTFQLPEMDKYDQTKAELLAMLDVCMGGRIAEEIIHGPENVTSGCSSDLSKATSVAKEMVTSYGMSDKIGPVSLSGKWGDWSADTRHLAEEEIRDLLVSSEQRTRKVLAERGVELERLAHGLLEYETLDKDDIERVVEGKKLERAPMCTNTVVQSDDIRDQRSLARS